MNKRWWKEAVVYQIYPRSFKDANGDGIGDLRGITEKLEYLQELGVSVVWLSPVFESPNDDNGYDISDYQAIMAEFGTFADWREMVDEMHGRGIKLIMDLVVNHTSDEHAWFAESRASKDNAYRDYYIWRPGKEGREPNNWASFFSGSAWQYDEATGEYYLHLFSQKQPDLNWENRAVRREVYKMMTWWLEQGVDGFRMDVINLISKVPGLPDAPETSDAAYHFPGPLTANGPKLEAYLLEMKREVLDTYDVLTVGEMPLATVEHAASITDEATGSLNMIFHFEHVGLGGEISELGKWGERKLELKALKDVMTRWQKGLEGRGWNSFYLSNHDQPRSVSRFGDDERYRTESAKMLAIFNHTLHGTPYIYQGEEIGMTNVAFDLDDYRDIETLNMYQDFVYERGMPHDTVMSLIYTSSRDNARTPVQWDDSDNAGFTTGTPWINVNPNYKDINVAAALADKDSVFYTYKHLIALRKAHPVMVYGTYDLLLDAHPEIYAYTRTLEDQKLLVILNFSASAPVFELPVGLDARHKTLLISNYEVDEAQGLDALPLRPYEARVYAL